MIIYINKEIKFLQYSFKEKAEIFTNCSNCQ